MVMEHNLTLHFVIFLIISCSYSYFFRTATATVAVGELRRGFSATPTSTSTTLFQPILTDTTGNFSMGLLRVNESELALAVVHVASTEPLWLANPDHLARWSEHTRISFNGSLVISGSATRVYWSSGTDGDKILLLNTSNLQIQKQNDAGTTPTILWQSFNFPYNTLVENQNFSSTMSLVSSNGLYVMRLGDNFLGLYAKFSKNFEQLYYKHTALQAKARITEDGGPIYAVVNSSGYIGMYQNSTIPVDVEAFNTFERPIDTFLFIRLEPDGNLKGYYWNSTSWNLGYQAIKELCELPSSCSSYGLCTTGVGCSCLDNRTELRSGSCSAPGAGDFCGSKFESDDDYWVLRRTGVDLPYKEQMSYITMLSLEQCESYCANNCTCWGSVYNNGSQYCYILDYPIQSLVEVSDEGRIGCFKVRVHEGKGFRIGFGVGILMWVAIGLVFVGIIGYAGYRVWMKRRGVKRYLSKEHGVAAGPYKDLQSASFRSIEMSNR